MMKKWIVYLTTILPLCILSKSISYAKSYTVTQLTDNNDNDDAPQAAI